MRCRYTVFVVFVLAIAFAAGTLFSQSSKPAKPSFEVASVKAASDPSGPSLFTAVQDIGLKLEASRGPIEVLVIDSVQKPTEN